MRITSYLLARYRDRWAVKSMDNSYKRELNPLPRQALISIRLHQVWETWAVKHIKLFLSSSFPYVSLSYVYLNHLLTLIVTQESVLVSILVLVCFLSFVIPFSTLNSVHPLLELIINKFSAVFLRLWSVRHEFDD